MAGTATDAVVSNGKLDVKEDVELKQGISEFYNESSLMWEDMWGEHMHHGYYPLGEDGKPVKVDHRQAQVDMIDNVLKWAQVPGEEQCCVLLCGSSRCQMWGDALCCSPNH